LEKDLGLKAGFPPSKIIHFIGTDRIIIVYHRIIIRRIKLYAYRKSWYWIQLLFQIWGIKHCLENFHQSNLFIFSLCLLEVSTKYGSFL